MNEYSDAMQKEIRLPNDLVISSDYAIFLENEKVLAIADLHIGYEASLQAEGVAIPDFQLEIMISRLEGLLVRHKPETVVINGDLKHEFSRNRGQEWDEISRVLDLIIGVGAETKIVRGNHDNFLKTIIASRDIELVESIKIGSTTFVHGHKAVPEKEEGFTIYAHEHPVIRLKDEIGAIITLPCFLYDETNNFILLPAFSPLASGTNVISPESNFMIPELRDMDLSGAVVYAISEDGIFDFGKVEGLRRVNEPSGFDFI